MDSTVLQRLMAYTAWGNSLRDYFLSLAIGLSVWLILRVAIRAALARVAQLSARTARGYDDVAVRLVRKNLGAFLQFAIALYAATRLLTLSGRAEAATKGMFLLALTVACVRVLQDIVIEAIAQWTQRTQPHTPTTTVMLRNLATVVRFVLWAGALLFVLGNLGLNVNAFIAGLGVGGVAVALAVQHLLGDAISSFAIFLDKPFEVGDFIVVGDYQGTIEYIGFKTTRLRSLTGEQLILGNRDLEGSRIRNFKRMAERRCCLGLSVIYETPIDLLRRLPAAIEAIVREHKLARFERAHFQGLGESGLLFEAVYFVQSPDYAVFMDVQQSVTFRIIEVFGSLGVVFAYPTQLVYSKQS